MMRESPLFYQWLDLGKMFSYFYRYAVLVLGAMTFFCLGKNYMVKHYHFLSVLGTITLGIYAFNFIAIDYAKMCCPFICEFSQAVFVFVLALAISIIATFISKKLKYVRTLLIGE